MATYNGAAETVTALLTALRQFPINFAVATAAAFVFSHTHTSILRKRLSIDLLLASRGGLLLHQRFKQCGLL